MAKAQDGFSGDIDRAEHFRTAIRSTDSFDKKIADSTTNEIDLASQYEFNPERLRLFRNGSRAYPHYNNVSQFTDGSDVWTMQPDAGDTMLIESAESSTYSVQYVLKTSWAFSINQELQSGDELRTGPFNDNNGWYLEHRGSDHANNEVDIFVRSGGTDTELESNVILPDTLTGFHRYECEYNWYNVGHQIWKQTYTEDGKQFNQIFAKTSTDDERATESPNLPFRYEIEASSSTTGLEMNVGSGSIITLGDVSNLTRLKQQYKTVALTGSLNTWEPIYAMRIDPNQSKVNAELNNLDILQFSANDDVEMIVVSVDPSKTDASGFSINGYHHTYNSAIQTTESVTEVPDATNGTQQDLGSTQKPGGHTIASAVLLSGGGQSDTAKVSQAATETKKTILDSDVVVFCARSGTVDADIEFVWEVQQNW